MKSIVVALAITLAFVAVLFVGLWKAAEHWEWCGLNWDKLLIGGIPVLALVWGMVWTSQQFYLRASESLKVVVQCRRYGTSDNTDLFIRVVNIRPKPTSISDIQLTTVDGQEITLPCKRGPTGEVYHALRGPRLPFIVCESEHADFNVIIMSYENWTIESGKLPSPPYKVRACAVTINGRKFRSESFIIPPGPTEIPLVIA